MQERFMQEALDLAVENVRAGRGGPFAALIVKHGMVIARGTNLVTSSNDPTAHAEVMAIRRACEHLGHFQLDGCVLYTTCEPCPMCLGAIYWARPHRVFYSATHAEAATAGFDDSFIYSELDKEPADRKIVMTSLLREEAHRPFTAWQDKADRVRY